MRVVVADDDPLARSTLVDAVREADADVIAEAHDGDAAVRAVRLHRPDLLITDMWMGHVNGVKASVAAKRIAPNLRVIIISRHVPVELATAGFLAGAEAVIEKDEFLAHLPVLLHGHQISALAAEPEQELSRREREIAEALISGASRAQVAEQLGISVNTVKTHVARIYAKTGAASVVQLARILPAVH